MESLKFLTKRGQIIIKSEFEKRYKNLLGDMYEDFMHYSTSFLKKSIRINTLKIDIFHLKKRLEKNWELTPILWCKEGFYIMNKKEKRFDIGNLLEHQLGYIYVQDGASMIPPLVLQPKPEEVILDLCAAPGSKTTQIAQYMKNKGVIIANDIDIQRIVALGMNLQRCGVSNTIITLRQNYNFGKEVFDKILVDAPCSATGTIRRSFFALEMWSPNFVKRMAIKQYNLLKNAFVSLKKGGILVYSTCSLEPEENEGVISKFLEEHDNAKIEDIRLKGIKRSETIQEFEKKNYNKDVKRCLRIWPQDNDTEGFFVAKIKKTN